jgi:hypothetical protein
MKRRHGRKIDDGTVPLRRNYSPGECLSHEEGASQVYVDRNAPIVERKVD